MSGDLLPREFRKDAEYLVAMLLDVHPEPHRYISQAELCEERARLIEAAQGR